MHTTKKTDARWIIRFFCGLILGVIFAAVPTFADDYTVDLKGFYSQSDAREMLRMINEFRTGSDAWYWDENNTQKIYLTDLAPLEYDYELEKVAMLRAMEQAISFGHTRPNGTSCYTAFTGTYYAAGENVARGYPTVTSVFRAWQETDKNYNGQGHRRNMLSVDTGFTAVGIGHVIFNGTHFWTQEFRKPTSSAPAEEPLIGETVVPVPVSLNSGQIEITTRNNVRRITMEVFREQPFPEIVTRIYPSGNNAVVTEYTPNWTSSDSNVVGISEDGSKIIARKVGNAEISTTYLGKTLTIPVTITPIDISADTPSAEDRVYTGTPQEPDVSLVHDSTTLINGTDYDVQYIGPHTDAATVEVRVNGKGNYKGTAVGSFQIKPASIATAAFSAIDPETYNGQEHKPVFSVTWNGRTLSNTADYTTEYAKNTDAGTATITITGKGNFENGTSTTFLINRLSIEENEFSLAITDPTYTGDPLQPEMVLKNSFATLQLDKDFSAAYSSNTNAGENTAEAVLTGNGNYCGTRTEHFSVLPRNLQDKDVVLNVDGEYIFNGGAHVPGEDQISLNYKSSALLQGTDYEISSITNNVNAGDAVITLQGKGNYTGTAGKTFTILPKDITGLAEIEAIGDVIYNANAQTPAITVLLNSVEMGADEVTISYKNNVNVGTASVRAEGKGNYTGFAERSFSILPAELTSENASVTPVPAQTETGRPIEVHPTVKWNGITLSENKDYTLEFSGNTTPGTATVKILGTGNFAGGLETTFEIKEKPVEKENEGGADGSGSSGKGAADGSSNSGNSGAATGKGGPAGEGASESAAAAAILTSTSDEGPAGTKFSLLQAQQKKVTKNSITIKWKKINGATYKIFGNACGKKNRYVYIDETRAASYKHSGLKKGTYYKYLIVAIKDGKVVSTSKTLHIATSGKKAGNNTKVTISKKTLKLKAGKSKKLTAKAKTGKLKVKKHRKLAWESSDPTTVSVKNGKVKALKKGKATIYAYAQNGKFAKCKVTVK